MRVIKYFGKPKKFIDNLYQRGGKDKIDAAYIDEAINFIKLDPIGPKSRKITGIKTKHSVFRIKCKKSRSYRIFYTRDKNNVVILDIDTRDKRTYSKDMINKLKNRVKMAEAQEFLK